MRIPPNITQTVAFLYINRNGMKRAMGTAFFVAYQPIPPDGPSYVYTVTARHVIEKCQQVSDDQTVWLRANLSAGGSGFCAIALNHWIMHPTDAAADVAVLSWSPPADQFEFLVLPLNLAVTGATLEGMEIGVGDDVFITGCFVNHAATQRIQPIVRVGTLAAMPAEPVQTMLGPADAYLTELRSIGGLSGSPVFVHLGLFRQFDSPDQAEDPASNVLLLGIVQGHWGIPVGTSMAQAEAVNMGIGIVTPISKLLETLESEACSSLRAR